MTLLSDGDITTAFRHGRIKLDPSNEGMLQPASIDVRLCDSFVVFDAVGYTHIDPKAPMPIKRIFIPAGEAFVLHPGAFVLGATVETLTLDASIAARLEGKSSLGRLGLLTHATAGFVDPGFDGTITLELSNVANLPILLWPGMKIGQLCFFDLSSPATSPYGLDRGSNYQGQRGPTPSRSYAQFDDYKEF